MQFEVKINPAAPYSYRITIGTGLLTRLFGMVETAWPGEGKFVVTDANLVSAGHLRRLVGRRKVPVYVIEPPGEKSKNIDTVAGIVEAMEKASLGRDTLVIALGGGTVGDVAGFAAGIFKRGVKIVHVPTTTVAQADSSIGGKTGVDSTISKNAYGVFWQPAAVYIDVDTLGTLDERQYRSGLVESLKHALIADRDYFDFFEQNITAILARNSSVLERMAYHNCRIKADVVSEDPTETNRRQVLNYGHTIGHAVESVSSYRLLHGEAVAIGIAGAMVIERQLELGDDSRMERVRNILLRLGMPLKIPNRLKKADIVEVMKRDKKSVSGRPRFVLLEDIGRVRCLNGQWAQEVPRQVILSVLDQMY